MSYFYGLLAVAGWVWLAIVGVFLFMKWRRSADGPSESLEDEVARSADAKQH